MLSWLILTCPVRKSPTVRSFLDTSVFSDVAFMCTTCGAILSAIAYYLPIIYLPLFAETGIKGFHNTDLAFYLVSIANGASILGRLLSGLVAAKIGPIETCGIAVAISAVLLYGWFGVESPAAVVVWAALWGLISSVIVAMPGAIVPLLSPSPGVIGTLAGTLWAGVGIGMLIGSPIAGALIKESSGGIHWWRAQLFAALCMTFSSFFFIYPIIYVRRRAKRAEQSRGR
jgi:MFS family permease